VARALCVCLGLRGEIHASRASDKIVWSLETSSLKARAEFRRVIPLEIHALGDDGLEPQTAGVPEDCRAVAGHRLIELDAIAQRLVATR